MQAALIHEKSVHQDAQNEYKPSCFLAEDFLRVFKKEMKLDKNSTKLSLCT